MKYPTLLLVWFMLSKKSDQELNLIRKTRNGLIRGALTRSEVNAKVEYYAFRGVPYARPPVADLRFQEPVPSETWFGVRDATILPSECAQMREYYSTENDVIGSEDCLYLQIYEPKTVKKQEPALMPVMVWLHGGAFIIGSVVLDGPDYFMEKPVIVVSVSYRLSVFGFLSTNDEFAKGNFGLKDQALALKWVQENIRNFGGDPSRVTIFGASAGGASVQYHMVSEKSQGLFQRGICQSGSTLNRWALQENSLKMTHRLAKGLGIVQTENQKIVEELRKIDYKVLTRVAFNETIMGSYMPYNGFPFVPSIESESDTAFISESTFILLKKGKIANKVPVIMGHSTEEGSYGYFSIISGRVDINAYEENPELLIPISMNVTKESQCYNESLHRIKSFYFNNASVTDKQYWIPYMSQELFVRGIMKSVEFMRDLTPFYLYRFSYSGSQSTSFLGGAGHYDDVSYIWATLGSNSTWMDESDKLTSERFVTMWTNFAAKGNPTPDKDELLEGVIWPTVGSKMTFLDFGQNLTVLDNLNQVDYEFWEKLFGDCGKPPYNTY